MIAPWISTEALLDPVSPFAEDAVEAASHVLFMLSGRKYGGVRQTTEEYCQIGLNQFGAGYGHANRAMLPGAHGYPMAYPELEHGVITNRIWGECNNCGCAHLLRLRGGPVLSVEAVYREGSPIDLADVVICDYSHIAVLPGRCWGTCGDLVVTYTYGAPPPALGRMAAVALADQYLLAMSGSDDCMLPQRVTQISRQGTSWTLLDPQDFLDKGRTGVYQVDLFLTAVNPDGARLRSRVFSPDTKRAKTPRAAVPTTLMSASGAALQLAPTSVLAAPMTVPPPPDPTVVVVIDPGRPLRWMLPGDFTPESPPTLVVRPSGEEVPPDTLSWRSGNFTLDLSSAQVEQYLPPGSVLVVSSTGDAASTSGQVSYPVERRTL
jgi:hypothetical protein